MAARGPGATSRLPASTPRSKLSHPGYPTRADQHANALEAIDLRHSLLDW